MKYFTVLQFDCYGTNRYRHSTNAKRRYVLTDKARAAELLTTLEVSAIRIEGNPVSIEELEDVRDIERGLAEYRRTGKTYLWEDVKAEIEL